MHEPCRERQTQPRTFDSAHRLRVEPFKRPEQLVTVSRPNPRTGIGYFEACAVPFRGGSQPNLDRAGSCEFHRIAEQIDEHLLQPRRIG